jgi:hypothetical protein
VFPAEHPVSAAAEVTVAMARATNLRRGLARHGVFDDAAFEDFIVISFRFSGGAGGCC